MIFFDRDWLNYNNLYNDDENSKYADLFVNLDLSFFENLKLDQKSCKIYMIEAAMASSKHLGDNIALCISGGVDSQAMLHAFIESGLKFKAYTFVFNNELNSFDVDYARHFCKSKNIQLIEIPFNIVAFLNRENYDYGITYKSASPHFNAHYKFCDILKDLGHSGVCFGGYTPYPSKIEWGNNYTKNSCNYINYSKIKNYPVQGNFLSFYPELSWATALLTPKINVDGSDKTYFDNTTRLRLEAIRYTAKVYGYGLAGFDVIESQKRTGFELVKDYFKNQTGNGLEFEDRFRKPLETKFLKIKKSPRFIFKNEVLNFLNNFFKN